jgi:serine/threonine-protein kinase RsbW
MVAGSEAGSELKLNLRNDPAEIGRLAALVVEFGTRHRLPAAAVSHVNLALEEAVSNIIAYAHDDSGPHDIAVRIALVDGALSIELSDDGRAFDPRAAPAPDLDAPLEERPVGGLGIHLVRRLMDEVHYRREGGRNHLSFAKRIG